MSFLSQPLGLSTLFPNNRQIDDITVDVIISESTNDTLTVTKQPVQQGASITDHAYSEPTVLSMQISFRDRLNFLGSTTLEQIYQKLLKLQAQREPFPVFTPKRLYDDMLITALGMTTDKNTENSLSIQISFQQVILVEITTVQVPASQQKLPGVTQATQNSGVKNPSALQRVFGQ